MSHLIESADRWRDEVRRAASEIGLVSSYCAAEALYWLCGGSNLRFFLKKVRRSGKDRWWVGAEGSPDWIGDPLGDPDPAAYAGGRMMLPPRRSPGKKVEKLIRVATAPALAGAVDLARVAFPGRGTVKASVEVYATTGLVVRVISVQNVRRALKIVPVPFQMASSGIHDRIDDAIDAVLDQLRGTVSQDVLES